MENDTSQCHDLITKITERVPETTMTDWKAFVKSQLADTNERNTILPPNQGYSANSERWSFWTSSLSCVQFRFYWFGFSPRLTNDDDDDDQDFREIQFHSETMQQVCSDSRRKLWIQDDNLDVLWFSDVFRLPDAADVRQLGRLVRFQRRGGVFDRVSSFKKAWLHQHYFLNCLFF